MKNRKNIPFTELSYVFMYHIIHLSFCLQWITYDYLVAKTKIIKIMTHSSLFAKFFLLILNCQMRQIRNTKLLKRIAIVIKQLREEKDVSQEMVYNDTNIHVGRIETAKANPTVSTLDALCDYFGISLSEFHKRVEDL